jgi:ABC-type multidrug transport system ATPase subunit
MIEIKELKKSFGPVQAVRGVNLEVNEGELFGVIGPDGAGKSTLFRILISLLLPDSGSVRLWGLDPVADYRSIRQMVGYMPGKFSLYQDLSVEENLRFFATVFGTTIEENYHLIKDIYQQIEPFKTRAAGKLSGGMKQKLALSCALIHKPKLLVLDEPTTGVDAASRSEFWDMLKKLRDYGITILVSTPYMDEASLCDRVALMQNGMLLDTASPKEIVARFTDKLFGVKGKPMFQLITRCRQFKGIQSVYPFGEEIHVTFADGGDHRQELEEYLSSHDLEEVEIRQIAPNIEDRFIDLMRQDGLVAKRS